LGELLVVDVRRVDVVVDGVVVVESGEAGEFVVVGSEEAVSNHSKSSSPILKMISTPPLFPASIFRLQFPY